MNKRFLFTMLGGGQVIVQQVLGGTVYAPSNRVPVGTEVTLQISPDEGYSLTSIAIYDNKNNLISNSATFIMPNGDVTVIPSFIELGGTINLSQATGGNISVDKQGFVRQGTLVTVTASPSSGYYLSNLTVSLPSGSQNITSSKQFIMPNGNVSVSVSWAKNNYNVSITQVTGGTISASKTGSMPWGTTVTVSASANNGYYLNSLSWNGNAINSGESFVTPKADVNITGSFLKQKFTLNVTGTTFLVNAEEMLFIIDYTEDGVQKSIIKQYTDLVFPFTVTSDYFSTITFRLTDTGIGGTTDLTVRNASLPASTYYTNNKQDGLATVNINSPTITSGSIDLYIDYQASG